MLSNISLFNLLMPYYLLKIASMAFLCFSISFSLFNNYLTLIFISHFTLTFNGNSASSSIRAFSCCWDSRLVGWKTRRKRKWDDASTKIIIAYIQEIRVVTQLWNYHWLCIRATRYLVWKINDLIVEGAKSSKFNFKVFNDSIKTSEESQPLKIN